MNHIISETVIFIYWIVFILIIDLHMRSEELSELNVEDAEFCVVDVETTGLSPAYNGVIEIGLVKVSKLKITDKYHSLINPGREIPYYITQLTGISGEDIYDAPFFGDIAAEIDDFISGTILTAHNYPFDSSFLRKEFRYCGKDLFKNPGLCTLKLSRRLYPNLKSKSLGSVCRHLNLHNSNEHRALGDAETTAKLLIKLIKELKKNHQVKSVNQLLEFQSAPKAKSIEKRIKKSLAEDVSFIPDVPGIYYFLNSKGEIIYIGKAKSLKNRLRSYFMLNSPRKAKKIVGGASRLKIQVTNSELTALLMEAELIKIINPKHNTQLKTYGNKYFLKINKRHSFPYVDLVNYFDFDGDDYFGLFISRKKAETVLEMITKAFGLRECSDSEFNKGKACFLADIERCTAPCINNNTSVYGDELSKVYDFLYGRNQYALNRLLNKMKDYSERQKYEKASEVKGLIDLILSQTHKSSLLAEPVNSANVLFEISEKFGKDYLLMLEGKIFVKKYAVDQKDFFEEALDDYFNGTVKNGAVPGEEDLEKMKISLNWLIKNRNKARILYLKDYTSKEELYLTLSKFGGLTASPSSETFDIKYFLNREEEQITD